MTCALSYAQVQTRRTACTRAKRQHLSLAVNHSLSELLSALERRRLAARPMCDPRVGVASASPPCASAATSGVSSLLRGEACVGKLVLHGWSVQPSSASSLRAARQRGCTDSCCASRHTRCAAGRCLRAQSIASVHRAAWASIAGQGHPGAHSLVKEGQAEQAATFLPAVAGAGQRRLAVGLLRLLRRLHAQACTALACGCLPVSRCTLQQLPLCC